MPLNYQVGSFVATVPIDDQVVTGIPFTPKALIFFGNSRATNGAMADYVFYIGMVDSAINQSCMFARGQDVVGVGSQKRYKLLGYCVNTVDAGGSSLALGSITSFNSNGFNIFWEISPETRVHYIAFGGNNFNSFCGSSLVPTTTGLSSITGVGFKPDCVFIIFNGMNSVQDGATNVEWSIGAMERNGSQGVTCLATDGDLTYGMKSYQRSTLALARIDLTAANARIYEAAYSSMDADGFTMNWTTVSRSTTNVYYWLALKGINLKIGEFTHATEVGNLAITGIGFNPKINLFASACSPVSTSVTDVVKTTFGVGKSPTEQGTVWAGEN